MMRSIICTHSTGNAPAAVSPESISASAPSQTALATSLASARVGRRCSVMLSSIWVATITGTSSRSAARMMRRCQTGTSSGPTSTPRSPRATITPSEAATMASSARTARPVSIFAMIGMSAPSARTASRASSTSAALCTKESAR